ncbi:hypothetical protein AGR7C_Lc150017 [Agrobacterium deltaense Zutra 3/1]|uniref:Uncharacterized protein n=1 Tax=Agrobacterium deltaense Zutra 3/1 TaxID=1183427 RepID=A0A1S7RE82_9HYPH|nr:hypothetical protein AGR7C_Lc150017 [Agrobacterium deltaense Zutra 3/1]
MIRIYSRYLYTFRDDGLADPE